MGKRSDKRRYTKGMVGISRRGNKSPHLRVELGTCTELHYATSTNTLVRGPTFRLNGVSRTPPDYILKVRIGLSTPAAAPKAAGHFLSRYDMAYSKVTHSSYDMYVLELQHAGMASSLSTIYRTGHIFGCARPCSCCGYPSTAQLQVFLNSMRATGHKRKPPTYSRINQGEWFDAPAANTSDVSQGGVCPPRPSSPTSRPLSTP